MVQPSAVFEDEEFPKLWGYFVLIVRGFQIECCRHAVLLDDSFYIVNAVEVLLKRICFCYGFVDLFCPTNNPASVLLMLGSFPYPNDTSNLSAVFLS